jgi:murein DD-endopeptidase MepM/ murein hydrolase activator NlpD
VILKNITIMLVPEGANGIRQIKFPKILLYVCAFLLIGSSAYLSHILSDYRALKGKLPQISELDRENTHQKKQFAHLAGRIDLISREMEELRKFDHRLRVMVYPEMGDENGELRGVGGSDPRLLRPDFSSAGTQKELVRLMNRSLDVLNNEISVGKQDKADFHKFLEKQKMLLASTPSIWPTKGWLSSRFGYRVSPFTGEREFHKGLDISSRMSAPIIAPANGIVDSVTEDFGYGKMLTLKHGRGLTTRYAHLQKFLVKKGEQVKRGDTIALVGSTGRSTGPHLHYEVLLNGVAVNPQRYILN